MDRGNLVAEEDVMTKLTAIKTDKILHFYQPAVKCILSHKFLRDGASWRNYLRPHGLKFHHLSQVCLSYSSDLSELRKCSQTLATLASFVQIIRLSSVY